MGIRRKLLTFATVVGVGVIGGGFASAETGTQTVSYAIVATRTITVASNTVGFGNVGRNATAEVTTVTGPALTWSTDATGDKITVGVEALDTGIDLFVKGDNIDDAGTPCASTNEGSWVSTFGDNAYGAELETTRDFINGITNCGTSGTKPDVDTLTYKLVTTNAAVAVSTNKTVTWTITA